MLCILGELWRVSGLYCIKGYVRIIEVIYMC